MSLELFGPEIVRLCDVAYTACEEAETERDRAVLLARLKTAENAILEVKHMVERFTR